MVIKTRSFLFLRERIKVVDTIFLLSCCCLCIFCWLCKSEWPQRNNLMPSDSGISTRMTGKRPQESKWVTSRLGHQMMLISAQNVPINSQTMHWENKHTNRKTVRQRGLVPSAAAHCLPAVSVLKELSAANCQWCVKEKQLSGLNLKLKWSGKESLWSKRGV